MTTEQTATLVQKDNAGSYYLVSQETWSRAAFRRAAACAEVREEADTQGFAWAVSFNPFTYLDAIPFGALEGQSMRRGGGVRRTKQRRTASSDTERKPR